MRSILMCMVLIACGHGEPASKSTESGSTAQDPNCGLKTDDWCPAPAGDPCGEHKDKASCYADARCAGIRYRGESFAACNFDARGFADNCPTVGCISLANQR